MDALTENDTIRFKCSESLITCQICMEIFESPRILPCQHNFCKECVISLVRKYCLYEDGRANGKSFPCPICRKECKIRQKGMICIEEHLKCFSENLLMKSLLESVEDAEEEPLEKSELDPTNAYTQHGDGTQGVLYMLPDDEYFTRNIFEKYIYFLSTIQYFISTANHSQPFMGRWTLNRLRRSELIDLVYDLCIIPTGIYDTFRFMNLPNLDREDLPLILSYIKRLETEIIEELRWGWYNGPEGSFGVRNVQTQTENMSGYCFCSRFFQFIKDILSIVIIGMTGYYKLPYETANLLFALVAQLITTVVTVWILLEYTFTLLMNLIGVSFIIVLPFFIIFDHIHSFRRKFFVSGICIIICSLRFAKSICRCCSTYYALQRIFILFDFWYLCKLICSDIVAIICELIVC